MIPQQEKYGKITFQKTEAPPKWRKFKRGIGSKNTTDDEDWREDNLSTVRVRQLSYLRFVAGGLAGKRMQFLDNSENVRHPETLLLSSQNEDPNCGERPEAIGTSLSKPGKIFPHFVRTKPNS
jgi:hypothetical protein